MQVVQTIGAEVKNLPRESRDDNIYYNVNQVNNSSVPVIANFTQQLSGSIVDNPDNYYLSIVRFNLNGESIPILLWPTNFFYVALSYNGFSFSQVVVYDGSPNEYYINAVYSYQKIAEFMTTAYEAAFTGLVALSGPLPGITRSPYMVFNVSTNCFDIYAEAAWATLATAKIWMNSALFANFSNYLARFEGHGTANKQDYQILVKDIFGTNTSVHDPSIPAGYIKMTQEYTATFRWTDANSIVFKSSRMNVRAEYITGTNTSDQLVVNNSAGAGIASSQILTDFIPTVGFGDLSNWRNDITYTPSAQYRLLDLLGVKQDIIDIQIFWENQRGELFPYYIPPGTASSIKMAFLKKSLFKNYKTGL